MKDDFQQLQGDWQQVAYERDGVKQPIDDEAAWNPRTTFRGNEFIVTIADGTTPIKGTFTIDNRRK